MSKRLILALLLALQWGLAAASASLPRDLHSLLDRYRVPDAHIGLYIAPVDDAANAMVLNPLKPFNPASVIKLLPSIAALETFSPSYQWPTDVYTTGQVSGGTLHGNLYLKGGGDPYLTVEAVWAMLKAVHALGIERIAGDIVVDDHIFKLPVLDRSAFDGKPYRVYNGPADGLMVNFWAVSFTITALADEVHVDAFPASRQLKIVNKIKHSSSRCTRAHHYVDYDVEDTATSVVVTFKGVLSEHCPPVLMTRAVIPADRYLSYILPGLWHDAGGALEGRVRNGFVPDGAKKIYSHPSRSLAEVVQATNKFSNNLMARHLLLTLGTVDRERGVTVTDGVNALRDWLLDAGIKVPGLNVMNGSGLSRDTRISAQALANILRFGYHSRYAPEFLSSMPIAGEDRALKHRSFEENDASIVRIKTGLLDDVRAMAGYITSRRGRTYIAVLLINHKGVHRGLGTQMQNAFIQYVLDL